MAGFMKVLFRNLLEGPSTDPYPLGETFTPARLRGKCVVDPDLCMGCGVCKNVCAAEAIDITQKADNSGYAITIWQNSCCLCASCRTYCPTGAMSIINDWHSAQPQSEKYDCLEQHVINYTPCKRCGELFRPVPLKILSKLYAFNKNLDAEKLQYLCPKCRRLEDAMKQENFEAEEADKTRELSAPQQGMEIKIPQEPEKEKTGQAGDNNSAQTAANKSETDQ